LRLLIFGKGVCIREGKEGVKTGSKNKEQTVSEGGSIYPFTSEVDA
jgi:hypothetical protein